MVPTTEKIREEMKRSKITKRLRTRAQKAVIQKPGKGERFWRVLLPTNCLSAFGNFAGFAIKRFKVSGWNFFFTDSVTLTLHLFRSKMGTLYDVFVKIAIKIFAIFHLEHVYMRPEVNSNRSEISLRDKTSLQCEVTSLSAFTWLRLKWNSLTKVKFQTAVSFPYKQ